MPTLKDFRAAEAGDGRGAGSTGPAHPVEHKPAACGLPFTRRRWLGALLGAGAARQAQGAATPRVRLVVAAFPLMDQIVRAALPDWQRRHPQVDVQVLSRQYEDHHTAMTTALSTASAADALPDLMALEYKFMGRFAMGAGLEPLSGEPYHAEQLREHFVPFAFEQARNRDGALVALPTDIGPGTLFYRVDLLERAALAPQDLLASWDAYLDAGVRIKARTGAYLTSHAKYLKDIAVTAATPAGRSIYFDAQGQPTVTSGIFERAFELALRMRRLGLDAVVDTWQNEWAELLRRGRLATELSGAWMGGQLASWVAPEATGLWRASHLPENCFAGYGGSYYAMPRRASPARRALAWSLLLALTTDRELQLGAFRLQDAFPALLATQDDPFFEQPMPYLGGQRARLLWREAARRIVPRPLHRQHMFAEEVVNSELDRVLIAGKPIGKALADAQALLLHRARR